MGCEIAYRLVIPANEDRNTMREKIFELKDMQTRVFIVHMTFMLGTLLFSEAQNMKMMSNEYAWIIK
jgi:ionotropic glutamate receptor